MEIKQRGRLNKFVTVLKRTTTKNEYGEESIEYTQDAKRRCTVKHVSGKETEQTNEVFRTQKIEVWMQTKGNLEEQDQLEYNGHRYNIDLIDPGERGKAILIHAYRAND